MCVDSISGRHDFREHIRKVCLEGDILLAVHRPELARQERRMEPSG